MRDRSRQEIFSRSANQLPGGVAQAWISHLGCAVYRFVQYSVCNFDCSIPVGMKSKKDNCLVVWCQSRFLKFMSEICINKLIQMLILPQKNSQRRLFNFDKPLGSWVVLLWRKDPGPGLFLLSGNKTTEIYHCLFRYFFPSKVCIWETLSFLPFLKQIVKLMFRGKPFNVSVTLSSNVLMRSVGLNIFIQLSYKYKRKMRP